MSGLTRSAPMKRTGFVSRRPVSVERPKVCRVLTPIRALAPSAAVFRPQPKADYVDCEAYRRAVAALPCYRCGRSGSSQACHADEGKGMGIKACDLTCWPGCGPRMGEPGCHYLVGSTGTLNRGRRRAFELRAAEHTRCALIVAGAGDAALRRVLVKVGLLGETA